MTVRDVLLQAADLCERGWTQGISARDFLGQPCDARDPLACQWCAGGAILCATDGSMALRWKAQRAVIAVVDDWIPEWNDAPGRTQSEVVSALRRAAEQAGER